MASLLGFVGASVAQTPRAANPRSAGARQQAPPAAPEASEEPETPGATKLRLTGFVDVYGGPAFPDNWRGKTRGFRQFDLRSGEARLAVAQITAVYADPNSGFGFTLKPFFGDNADILYGFDSGDLGFPKYFAEAYGTYASRDGRLAVDLGKFYSWIGYESLESPFSDLYSRGVLFTNAQPNYHTGLRAGYPVTPRLGLSLYAVQGWNQTLRRTSGLSYGGQVRYAPNARDFLSLGVLTGREGSREANNTGGFGGIAFAAPGAAETTLFDLIATRALTPRTKIALNANHGSVATPDGGAFSGGTFYGLSGVVRQSLTSRLALSGRLENLFDTDGVRLGTSATLTSATLGLDLSLGPRAALRFELRGDLANAPIFGSARGPTRAQNTLNLAANVRF